MLPFMGRVKFKPHPDWPPLHVCLRGLTLGGPPTFHNGVSIPPGIAILVILEKNTDVIFPHLFL